MAKRGLASADKKTRQRVARMGGQASHGGGRPSGSKGGRSGQHQSATRTEDEIVLDEFFGS